MATAGITKCTSNWEGSFEPLAENTISMELLRMPRGISLFTFAVCLPLLARQKTDVIVMTNGDRLTCEIKKLDRGVLSVSLEYIDGSVSIDWSKVARLESNQLFKVETNSGTVYTGTLKMAESPSDQPRSIEVAGDVQSEPIERAAVVGVDQFGDSIWNRFHGNFSTGLIYNKSNGTTQYNLSSDVALRRERSTIELSYSSAFSTANGSTTATRNQVDLEAMRLLRWNQWFYAGAAAFLESSSQGINSQTVFGGGIGRYLWNSNSARVSLTGGLAELTTQYSERPTQNNLVALIAGDIYVFRFKKVDLTITPVLLPSLNDLGRVHFKLNSQYQVQIVSNLWWNITFYGNWDNRPPVGFTGSDYGASMGLTYK